VVEVVADRPGRREQTVVERGGRDRSDRDRVNPDAGREVPGDESGHVREDIAIAALYLASPAGAYVTGKVFEVDGGIESPNLDLGLPDL